MEQDFPRGEQDHERCGSVRAREAAVEVGDCTVHAWGGPDWDRWLAGAPEGPPADDVAIVPNLLFTSGTTGRPKATHLPPNVFPPRASWADFVEAATANRLVGLGRHLVVAPLSLVHRNDATRQLPQPRVAGLPRGRGSR